VPFHIYIIQSETTDRFYIGQTQNVEERLAYHNAGYSLSLRNRGPWKLVYTETFATRGEAVRCELSLKRQKSREAIQRLVRASRS
jgi:putative endonuclease